MLFRTPILQKYCTSTLTKHRTFSTFNVFRNHVKKPNKINYSQEAFNVNTNVSKDVILFKYDNPRFFKVLNIFALCQFGFWAYLSHFAFSALKDVPVLQNEKTNVWWRNINLGEKKYRHGITIISFMFGYGILTGAWIFSLKSVRYLILRKGGNAITLVTYGPFGRNRMMTVDLKHISAKDMRTTAKTYLPIKVQNQYFHYILDMKGEFKNQKLFDYTAGLKRNLM